MRSLIVTALALTTLRAATADACGTYDTVSRAPRLALVSTHSLGDATTRSFVVVGDGAPANTRWRVVAPYTYDRVQLAPAPALDASITVTVLGWGETRVIEARRRHYLRHSWHLPGTHAVVEVEATKAPPRIALIGRHADARWLELGELYVASNDVRWAEQQGLEPSIRISRLPGDAELDLVHGTIAGSETTLVRRRGAVVNRVDGQVLGGMTVEGVRYLVVKRGGSVRALRL
jgi:hypothetical protein